jgi:hypothetical protein
MRIARCPELRREIKTLCRNRPFVEDAIKEFERLLANETPVQGDQYGDLGLWRETEPASIYKYRVFVKGSGGGKRSGVRYVCEFLEYEGEQWALCLGVYIHS